MFPAERPRRLRATAAMRRLVAETSLRAADLVAPLFVAEGAAEPRPIPSMPGHFQHSLDSLVAEAKRLAGAGVGGLILFGVPAAKDELGSGAWDPRGVAQAALAELRAAVGDQLVVMADLCLDEYTTHGHCGVLRADGTVDNDATLELYARVALAQAGAGAAGRRAQRDDGRPGRRHPRRARRRRLRRRRDHGLRREVRERALRPVPRRGPGGDRRRRRPARLPDGLRATGARRCARRGPTSPRAPTS